MGKSVNKNVRTTTKRRAAMSPEARENQMISLAVDVAEQQMIEGTASSQVITHFLKLGSMKERLEREKLENENELLRARVKALESAEKSEEAYRKVLRAMREYSGREDIDDEEDYDEYDEYGEYDDY